MGKRSKNLQIYFKNEKVRISVIGGLTSGKFVFIEIHLTIHFPRPCFQRVGSNGKIMEVDCVRSACFILKIHHHSQLNCSLMPNLVITF